MSILENLTQNLKAADLRLLSSHLGLNITGNKSHLRSGILTIPTPLQPSRILSIDMGIRNLAYCVVDLPPRVLPKVTHWVRRAVPLYDSNLSTPSISLPLWAEAANALAQQLLAEHAPEHILIERQRWRSGGGANVLEWTIRVNTFEAMLHAVLFSLQRAGGEWTYESVDPGRVVRAWTKNEGGGRAATSVVKMLKKEVVRGWLREGRMVDLGGADVVDTGELVLLADERGAVKRSGEKLTAEEKKVDDLTDCLLQAVTWVKWQENRRRLLEGTPLPEIPQMLLNAGP